MATMEPVTKRAKKDPDMAEAEENTSVVDQLIASSDVWVNYIYPFLGYGYFAYVTGSKGMKENYIKFVEAIEDPPMVENPQSGRKIKLLPTHTFLKHAFVNVSCAQLFKDSRGGKHKLKLIQTYKQKLIAQHGTVGVMKLFQGNRKTWKMNCEVCQIASEKGDFEMVKYARQHGGDWGATAANAAEAGRLDILKYARDNGCRWDIEIVNNAARNGFIDILDYALEGGCENRCKGILAACYGGQIKVIEHLIKKWGMKLEKRLCMEAAAGGQLEALKYLRQQGCPWDHNTYWWAKGEVLEWVKENGLTQYTGYDSDRDDDSDLDW